MSMEFNKIFAAILVAGIVAMLTGFISDLLYHPQQLAENAYPIETPDTPAAGAATAEPAGPEPVGDLIATADIDRGAQLGKVCATCHTFDSGGPNRVGPNLHNIVGAKHAHAVGFAYSDAMKEKSAEAWNVEALNAFLWNPRKAVPGTKMVFAGIKKPEDRAAVIKWLESMK